VFRYLPLLPDLGYRVVASSRYLLRGRVEVCALPDPDARARFLA
jgi:predicted DCC family thiol-disulfide oxidoreductase YuxK